MASLLDISLLNYFSNVFVILFVFAATYAVLMFKNPFQISEEKKYINSVIAITLALMMIFSQDAIEIIKNTIPWYIIMLISLLFVIIIASAFNTSIPSSLSSSMGTYILVIAIIILLINVANKIGQQAGPYLSGNANPDVVVPNGEGDVASNSFTQNFGATLFHPKVLAMILVLIISLFAVLWIGYK
ncbi:MAG: hypothetical protein QXE31_03630 [Candidatus Woesearchaeota archaeon]